MAERILSAVAKLDARRGADVLLEILESEGVQYVFGNPGTTELPLMDALLGAPELQYILALQEASVVAMADGYAQAARRPAFINLHSSGGLGHGMGNLLNASICQTPLVITAGQQDSRHTVTDPLLFGDLVQIASPAVKWAQEIASADQLPILVRRAFHDSTAAPAGPVFLSLPMNVMEEMSTISIGAASRIERRAVAGSLDVLADLLVGIRPGKLAVIAGDEVYASNAAPEAVQLAEAFGALVYGSSWPLHIPFPTSHPLWAGNLPTKASEIAETFKPYDAIFALGGKSLITVLYSEASAVPPGCDVFQLSADVRDLGRTYPTKLSLVGDIKASLHALLPLLAQRLAGRSEAYASLCAFARRKQLARRARLTAAADAAYDAPLIAPIVAARETVRAIGPMIAIVDEAPATMLHLRGFLDSACTRQYSFSRGGALGWGMPAAVGWSLGLGREPVVCLVGDGAAMYSPQALWTAAHERLPVTFVVMNNRGYSILKNFLSSRSDYLSANSDRFIGMDIQRPSIDYVHLARAMGVPAARVDRAADIAPTIAAGIASGNANLVEVMISAS